MKRDWEIIREILIRLESKDEVKHGLRLADFPENQSREFSYNAELLIEAGLVCGKMSKPFGPPIFDFQLFRMTWQGHEFFDAIKIDTIWERTKKRFVGCGIAMTFDLVKQIAIEISTSYLKSKI